MTRRLLDRPEIVAHDVVTRALLIAKLDALQTERERLDKQITEIQTELDKAAG